MILIEPKVEYLPQEEGLQGMYKQIEIAGRTCYQSQDKITEDSAKAFVDMLTKSGHGAMLEHATVYLAMHLESIIPPSANGWGRYVYSKYSKGGKVCQVNGDKRVAVTTNYRVMLQGYYDSWDEALANNFDKNWLDDLQFICEPTEYHEKRYTFRFTTNIGISREFNRHRVNSIGEESTRFCGYYKGKFNRQITYTYHPKISKEAIEKRCNEKWGPLDYHNGEIAFKDMCGFISNGHDDTFDAIDYWLFGCLASQYCYMNLTHKCGWKPQDARSMLNLNTKTELVHTAFESDWRHFITLRAAANAHPEAQVLANQVKEILDGKY